MDIPPQNTDNEYVTGQYTVVGSIDDIEGAFIQLGVHLISLKELPLDYQGRKNGLFYLKSKEDLEYMINVTRIPGSAIICTLPVQHARPMNMPPPMQQPPHTIVMDRLKGCVLYVDAVFPLSQDENKLYEFKARTFEKMMMILNAQDQNCKNDTMMIMKILCSFLNSHHRYGILVFGVNDACRICGLKIPPEKTQEFFDKFKVVLSACLTRMYFGVDEKGGFDWLCNLLTTTTPGCYMLVLGISARENASGFYYNYAGNIYSYEREDGSSTPMKLDCLLTFMDGALKRRRADASHGLYVTSDLGNAHGMSHSEVKKTWGLYNLCLEFQSRQIYADAMSYLSNTLFKRGFSEVEGKDDKYYIFSDLTEFVQGKLQALPCISDLVQKLGKHSVKVRTVPATSPNRFFATPTPDVYVKTKMCKTWLATGKCPYKEKCRYSHTTQEQPNKPLCRNFEQDGKCVFGDKCHFLHAEKNVSGRPGYQQQDAKIISPPDVKPPQKVCRNWKEDGKCPHGDKCHFQHPEQEGKVAVGEKGKKDPYIYAHVGERHGAPANIRNQPEKRARSCAPFGAREAPEAKPIRGGVGGGGYTPTGRPSALPKASAAQQDERGRALIEKGRSNVLQQKSPLVPHYAAGSARFVSPSLGSAPYASPVIASPAYGSPWYLKHK